jgi:hypothetical protein
MFSSIVTVHFFQDFVVASLDRQVDKFTNLFELGGGFNEIGRKILRVATDKTDPEIA